MEEFLLDILKIFIGVTLGVGVGIALSPFISDIFECFWGNLLDLFRN